MSFVERSSQLIPIAHLMYVRVIDERTALQTQTVAWRHLHLSCELVEDAVSERDDAAKITCFTVILN